MKVTWFALGIMALLSLGTLMFIPNLQNIRQHQTKKTVVNDANVSASSGLTVAQVLATPSAYVGQRLCLTGYYEDSSILSGLAATADVPTKTLLPPIIWTKLNVPRGTLDCSIGVGNDERCFGYLTLCGRFDDVTTFSANTNAAPVSGFGVEEKYQYQLSL